MSTISKTEYYELTKYDNVDNPIILQDITSDHVKIDNALHGHDERLGAVEEIIETVSTQNIEDLMARLGAVEVKVDNNATNIQRLATNINGLSSRIDVHTTQIGNLATQISGVEGDIEYLKQCCDNVRTTLVEHGDRIADNETAIENINSEIIRINQGLIDNANDIHAVATQLQTIIDTKQDKLIEGTGIRIEDNVISVIGSGNVVGTYDSSTENLTLG